MDKIRDANLEDVSAISQRRAGPPSTWVSDEVLALQVQLDEARRAMWQGDLGAAQRGTERVLGDLRTRKRHGTTGRAEELQMLKGSAQSLLGQILAGREDLGPQAREALERAVDIFRPITSTGSGSAQSYSDYGAALYLLGMRTEAKHALEKAIDLGDTAPATARRLAKLLLEDGRAEQAKAVLRRVGTAVTGDVEILSLLGRAEQDLGETDAALSHMSEAAAVALQTGDLARALDLNGAAAALAPNDPELHASRGEILRLSGQMEDAVRAFDQALGIAPAFLGAKLGKADALRVLGKFERALELLEEVLREEPRHALALAIRGDILRILGDYDGALIALDASLVENPASAWAIGTRGQVLRALGRQAEARSDLERATGDVPELDWAWAELAAACYELGDEESALHAAEQALSRDPEIPLALAVQARCLVDTGRLPEAVGPLSRIVKLEPNLDWAWIDLAVALSETGDYSSAREVVERALANGHAGVEPFLLRAELRLVAGSDTESAAAADDLQTYLSSEPRDGYGLFRAGRTYRALGDNARAAEVLDLAMKLSDEPEIRREKAAVEFELKHFDRVLEALKDLPTSNADDLWRRGEAARVLGDLELANRSFKRALEQHQGYLPALNGLIELNQDRGKLDRAKHYASIALKEHPDDADTLANAANVELASLDYERAFAHLDRALAHEPDNPWALYNYGRCLMDIGHFRQAVDVFNRLRAQGEAGEDTFGYLGFALENAAIGPLTGREPRLSDEARLLLVRAHEVYIEGLGQTPENLYLQRGRADTTAVLDGSDAAQAGYEDIVTALESAHGYDRDLIGLLGWCYFRLGRHDEATRAYVSALSAGTGSADDYLGFDLALATVVAGQADHGRLEYRRARDLCDIVPVPRKRGLFQVARNDLVATLIIGGFSLASVAEEIVAEFDEELRELESVDTRPQDPSGNR